MICMRSDYSWQYERTLPVRLPWTRVYLIRYGCINQGNPTFSLAPDYMNHKQDAGFKKSDHRYC